MYWVYQRCIAISQLWCRGSAWYIFFPRSNEPYDISLAVLCSMSLRCQNRVMSVHKLAVWISCILSLSIIKFRKFLFYLAWSGHLIISCSLVWRSPSAALISPLSTPLLEFSQCNYRKKAVHKLNSSSLTPSPESHPANTIPSLSSLSLKQVSPSHSLSASRSSFCKNNANQYRN